MLTPEQRQQVYELLAYVYTKASPSLAKSRHSAWDVFNHRVRFSAGTGTLGHFISKLCNVWGIQSLPMEHLILFDALELVQDDVLRYLSREHEPACMRAIRIAQEWREARNAKRTEDSGNANGPDTDLALWGREDGLDADAPPDAGVLPI